MNDNFLDPWNDRQRRTIFHHAGFRLGSIGGVIMICVHIFMLLIFQATNQGDVLAWMLGWFVYYFIGRSAAQAEYDVHREGLDALRGVQGAGMGAALVTSLIVWAFIIIRGVFRDSVGVQILVEPVSLFCMVVIDVLIAIALGTLGAKGVVKKYTTFRGY